MPAIKIADANPCQKLDLRKTSIHNAITQIILYHLVLFSLIPLCKFIYLIYLPSSAIISTSLCHSLVRFVRYSALV